MGGGGSAVPALARRLPPPLHLAAHDLRRELRDRPADLGQALVRLQLGHGELPDVRRPFRRPLHPHAAAVVLALADEGELATELAEDHSTPLRAGGQPYAGGCPRVGMAGPSTE